MSRTKIYTIGDLRKAMKGLPANMHIFSQIAASDGTCWTAFLTLAEIPNSNPPAVCLDMRHPGLYTILSVEEHNSVIEKWLEEQLKITQLKGDDNELAKKTTQETGTNDYGFEIG